MRMNPAEMTPRYQAAAARVQKYDGNAPIGMCSTTEILRLEKLADQLEERQRKIQNSKPAHTSAIVLAGLWQRYWVAYSAVLEWQAELQKHRRELSIIGTPLGYFQAPEAIASAMPSLGSAAEYETYIGKFSHRVTDIEMLVTKLRDHCQQWTRLTPEQQTRALVMALAERL
jgi:hypothetical protein